MIRRQTRLFHLLASNHNSRVAHAMQLLLDILPHVNAILNATSALLLIVGFRMIRSGNEMRHRRVMLSAFAVSVLFLISYLLYHSLLRQVTGSHGKSFEYNVPAVRYFYFAILISHIVLAAAVPFLAVTTIYFGLRQQRERHRRLARWTFPVWLYVSVTGVFVYGMLYWLPVTQ